MAVLIVAILMVVLIVAILMAVVLIEIIITVLIEIITRLLVIMTTIQVILIVTTTTVATIVTMKQIVTMVTTVLTQIATITPLRGRGDVEVGAGHGTDVTNLPIEVVAVGVMVHWITCCCGLSCDMMSLFAR